MATSEQYRNYAAVLETLLAPGELLSSSSPHSTASAALPGGVPSPHRAALYDRVVDEYLSAQIRARGQVPDAERALTLVVGPPGSGKSSGIDAAASRGVGVASALAIERDELMRLLLAELSDANALPLPPELRNGVDGIHVVPAELHDLINTEGTHLAHRVAAVAQTYGWNVAWQNTLGDFTGIQAGIAEFRRAGYASAHTQAICLEAGEQTLLDRTYQRWEQGRRDVETGHDRLGRHWVTRSGLSGAFRGRRSIRRKSGGYG